jgi:hypothetical protein
MDRRPGKSFAVSVVVLDRLQRFAYAGLRTEKQWRLQKAATG